MSRNQLTRRITLSNLSVYSRRRFILSSMEIRKQPPIIPTQAGIVKMCTSVGDLQSICYTYILFYSSYLRSFTVPFCLFCRSLFAEEPPLKIYSVIKIMLNMASKMLFFIILQSDFKMCTSYLIVQCIIFRIKCLKLLLR